MSINYLELNNGNNFSQFQAKNLFAEIARVRDAQIASNIKLLHPESQTNSLSAITIDHNKRYSNSRNLVLGLFQELRPERRRQTHLVSYCMNKLLLLELANELLSQKDIDPMVKDLMNRRLAELKILFNRLERISQSQAPVKLLIVDHDFRSWFTNPYEYLDENSPLLEDPVPWTVDFDGVEFTLTRTEAVLAEQFTVMH